MEKIEDYSLINTIFESLYCECEVPPTLGEYAFDIAHNMTYNIYAPSDKVDIYKSADGQKEFASKIKPIVE